MGKSMPCFVPVSEAGVAAAASGHFALQDLEGGALRVLHAAALDDASLQGKAKNCKTTKFNLADYSVPSSPKKLCERLIPRRLCRGRRGINLSHNFFGQLGTFLFQTFNAIADEPTVQSA